jgi:hypothetical protein
MSIDRPDDADSKQLFSIGKLLPHGTTEDRTTQTTTVFILASVRTLNVTK